MKTLIVCYSFGGKTKKAASCLADQIKADFVQLQTMGNSFRLFSLITGVARTCLHRSQEILPLEEDISSYERIIIAGPVWAGRPAPAVQEFIHQYALAGKVTCGLLTCAKTDRKPMSFLRDELEAAQSYCANIIAIHMDPAMLRSLHHKEIQFISSKDGKLRLQAAKKETDSALLKEMCLEEKFQME